MMGYLDRPPSAKTQNMRKHSPCYYTSEKRVRRDKQINLITAENGEITLTYNATTLQIQIEIIYNVVAANHPRLVRSITRHRIQQIG